MTERDLKTLFYDNLRNITNIEQKIALSTVILYYHQRGGMELYNFLAHYDTYEKAVDNLKIKSKDWEIEFMDGTEAMELAFKECKETYINKFGAVDSKGRRLYEEASKRCPWARSTFEIMEAFRSR